jgi:hypothetical protein
VHDLSRFGFAQFLGLLTLAAKFEVFLVLGSWFLVLGSWFLVLGSWFGALHWQWAQQGKNQEPTTKNRCKEAITLHRRVLW